jgi:hypothetical protein
MFDWLKNNTVYLDKYKTDSEAVIVSCYFNPRNSPYRKTAFRRFYESVKHLNICIAECVIGNTEPELDVYDDDRIITVRTENLLWHKEGLLNMLIEGLSLDIKYVFWLDCDVIFSNKNWMIEGVKQLKTHNIIQPFENCIHLEKDQMETTINEDVVFSSNLPNRSNSKCWKSFCYNYAKTDLWKNEVYDNHGHVGFAWGARIEILKAVPLYDKALIGGADHIIAHAAAGQIGHTCITKAFGDNMDEINEWSKNFYSVVQGNIGYVPCTLYHIWHGDVEKRQYLKRAQDFAPQMKAINKKDENGLYLGDDRYHKKYFREREVVSPGNTFLDDDYIDSASDIIDDVFYLAQTLSNQDDTQIIDDGSQIIDDQDQVFVPGSGPEGSWGEDGKIYHEGPFNEVDSSRVELNTDTPAQDSTGIQYDNSGNLPSDDRGNFS